MFWRTISQRYSTFYFFALYVICAVLNLTRSANFNTLKQSVGVVVIYVTYIYLNVESLERGEDQAVCSWW